MLFARRNQCFARIIHAKFIFGGQPSVFHYPYHGLPAVSQDAAAGTFLLQLRFRELPCAGRRRRMYLRPEHFLFAFIPLVLEALGSDWTGEKIGEKGKIFVDILCSLAYPRRGK